MSISNSLLRTLAVVLVALAVLKVTKVLSAPILLALVVGVILSPVIESATRRKIPVAIAAAGTTLGSIAAIVGGLAFLAPAIEQALLEIPRAAAAMRGTLDGLLAFGQGIDQVTQDVGKVLGTETGDAAVASADLPSAMDAALFAPQIMGQALIFLGTLFFFLLTREDIYVWAGGLFSKTSDGKDVQSVIRNADRSVSRYFMTITAINIILGLCVTIGLYIFGAPWPVSWGLAAFLLNYVLYLGPAAFAIALLVMGHIQFQGLLSFGPMVMFLAMNFTEGYLLTPSLVGHRLRINPLVIFLALALGLWLWGIVGGIVALPLLVWVLAAAGLVSWYEEQPLPPATPAVR
ncbi:AI-2E family transporter (plasmid) [Rhodobacteraceae bacterium SC52]|nr:AI-2E family transporter [Rhodobacteraceae bacterium SC52]